MFNFRWGFAFAIIALIVSVFMGIISGVSIPHILLRSLVFAAVFFGLGAGIRAAIDSFFPELLFDDDEASEPITFDQPGSRVNITLGNYSEYAVPEKFANSDDSPELGNIEDLISGVFRPKTQGRPAEVRSQGIDRSAEADYNSSSSDLFDDGGESFKFQDSGLSMETETEPEAERAPVKQPVFSPSFGDDSGDGLGGLPDLDSMAMAFSGSFGGGGETPPAQAQMQPPAQSFEAAPDPMQYNRGNKPQPLQGDFNPKELAEGIRTVLIKDKG